MSNPSPSPPGNSAPRPDALPFPLYNPTTLTALGDLGLTPDDLTYYPLAHFKKSEKDDIAAQKMFQIHTERRKELIRQVAQQRKLILSQPDSDSPERISGETAYNKYMAEVNQKQLQNKEMTHKQILRRLAINQLRQAYKLQHGEEINNKVDSLYYAQQEKLQSSIQKAREAVETRDKAPVKSREVHTEDLLFQGEPTRKSLPSMEAHTTRYKTLQDQKRLTLSRMAQQTQEQIEKAKKRQNDQLNQMITSRMKTVEKTEYRASLIDGKMAARNAALEERGELRETRTKDVVKRNVDIETKRVQNAVNKIETKTIKSQKVQKETVQQREARIKAEKEILDKRNAEAENIFNDQKQKLQKYKRYLDQRDNTIEQKLEEQEIEIKNKLLDVKIQEHQKTVQVLNSKMQRESQSAYELRRKLERSTAKEKEARDKRIKSEMAKARAEETFREKKNDVLELLPRVLQQSDRQKINTLMRTLECTEEEAIDIINAAKTPASPLTHNT